MNAVIGETLASWQEFSTQQKLIATGVNIATFIRPVMAAGVAYRGRSTEKEWTWGDAALNAATSATDVEGRIANATGTTTKLGAVVDPITDKIATATQEGILLFRGEESVARFGLRTLRDIGVTAIRAKVVRETNGETSVGASWPGKANTALRMSTNIFSISPLGNKYPRTRKNLQRISTATTVASGLYNVATLLRR